MNKSINKDFYFNIFFLLIFFICFNEPIFRNSFEFCKDSISFSRFNSFINENRLFIKIVLLMYSIKNFSFVRNNIRSFKFLFTFSLLLFFGVIFSENFKESLIIYLNYLLYFNLIILFYYKLKRNLFLKSIFLYLLIISILSIAEIVLGLSNFYTSCKFDSNKINLTGFTFHKNQLGIYIFITNFIFFIFFKKKIFASNNLTLILFSIISLIFIDAVTALFLTLLVYFFRLFEHKKNIVSFYFVFIIIFLLFYNLENILNLFGRDKSLTGRIYIWEYIFNSLEINYFFGVGLGASKFLSFDNSFIIYVYEVGIIITIIYYFWIFINSNFFKNDLSLFFFITLLYSMVEGGAVIFSTNFFSMMIILCLLAKYYKNE